jgi:predicted RND superfamily exporter protein
MAWIRKPWLALSLMLILAILSTLQLPRLKVRAYFKAQVSGESHYVVAEREISRTFHLRDVAIVAVPYTTRDQINIVARELRSLDGVAMVINPFEFPLTMANNTSIAQRLRLIGQYEGRDYALLVTFISKSPESTSRSIHRLVEPKGGVMFGISYIGAMAMDYVRIILTYLTPVAIAIMFSIFYLTLKNFWAALLAFLPSILATVYLLGLYAAIGKPISMENVLMPFITLIMGSSAALHYVNRYLSLKDPSRYERSRKAFKETFLALFMTVLTTVVGFLSLGLTSSPVMRELGFSGAMGMTAAGVATFVFLPPTVTLIEHRRMSEIVEKRTLKKRRTKLLIFLALFTFFCFFINKVKADFHSLLFFRSNSKVMKGARVVEAIAGIKVPIFLKVDLDVDVESQEGLAALRKVKDSLKDHCERTFSILDLLELFPQPLRNFVSILLPEGILFDRENNSTLMLAFPKRVDSNSYEQIEKVVSSLVSGPIKSIKLSGEDFKYMEMNRFVIQNLRASLMFALLAIAFMMCLTLKNFKLGLVSCLPIVATLFSLYGAMGLLKVPLNAISACIMSIVLGAGIDYAIHFSCAYLKHGSLEEAYRFTLRPIVANAFGVALGFSVLFFSPMKVHAHIAALILVGMVLASTYTLLWLTAILPKTQSAREARRLSSSTNLK